ncbi:MAG: endonuclease/exonuclease/phosphatase family protein [Luteolibacter sp.]|uniref:endonuclease/exonuclease/phosphatase family protein n=1 Tax=Luteolibacter sp. TaxID=1962973 RepID=UPI0032662464
MKFRLLSLSLLVALSSLGSCQRSRAVGPPKAVAVRSDGAIELNLMSFNVRYENPGDLDDHAWRQRVTGAVRMIRREAPDIIGVQEALHGQAADLWASLPDYEFFGIGRDDGLRAGEYSGIFYRKERFKPDPDDHGTFWLSDTPAVVGSRTWGNEIPRVAAWIRLIDLSTMRGFYVFNTHWDHRNQESRERAALLIAQRIDTRKQVDEPVTLIGDFNSLLSNPGIVYLTGKSGVVAGSKQSWSNGLSDAYQTLHSNEKNHSTTLHFWKGSREGEVKIDHILVSRGAKIEAAEIVSDDKPVVSDHFPVTARILFPLTK